MWTAEIKGNTFYLRKGNQLFRRSKGLVEVRKTTVAGTEYQFNDRYDTFLTLDVTEIQDLEGNAFTIETFDEFIDNNLGFNPATGGSVASELQIDTITINGNQTITTNVDQSEFIEVYQIQEVLENQIIGGVVLPYPQSTNEQKLTDDNTTNTGPAFNNLAPGAVNNIALPTIDFGRLTEVQAFKIYWFNDLYYLNDYRIEGSNDGINWQTIQSFNTVPTSNEQEIVLTNSVIFSFYRIFSVSAQHPTYWVINEIDFFREVLRYKIPIQSTDDISIKFDKDNKLIIENLTSITTQLEIHYNTPV